MPKNRLDLIEALVDTAPLVERPDRCIRLRSGRDCSLCLEVCPVRLPLSGNSAVFDRTRFDECLRCGGCAAACPTGAIEQSAGGRAILLRAISLASKEGVADLHISCMGRDDTLNGVQTRCLKALDPALVFFAFAQGFEHVVVHTASCEECPAGGTTGDVAPRKVSEIAEWVDSVLPSHGISLERSDAPVPPDAYRGSERLDRRAALVSLRHIGLNAVGAIVSGSQEGPDTDAGGTPVGPSSGRRVVRAALSALSVDTTPAGGLPHAIGQLNHEGPRVVRDQCYGCGDCARFCPTGALEAYVRDEEWRLSFTPSRCSGCKSCAELCRAGVIAHIDRGLEGIMSTKRLVQVRRIATVCSKCTLPFAARQEGERLCFLCRRATERFADCY